MMKFVAYLAYNFVFLFKFNFIKFLQNLVVYFSDMTKYARLGKNKYSAIRLDSLMPYLADKTIKTEIEPIYFLQDIWFAEKIFKLMPKHHIDIGSSIKTVAIISKKIPTTFVDLRPPDIEVEGLNYLNASILNLPFRNNSIKSLSSICVVEHIGLGRYGDTIDPVGSEKAISEIIRVIEPKGALFLSVPVDSENKTHFNAHRTFTRDYFLSLFIDNFSLKEEKYIYGKKIYNRYNKEKGFGTGLYYFVKK